MRPRKRDPIVVRWVIGRADAFIELEDGTEVPAWSYREIARMLWKSRKVKLASETIRTIVKERRPELLQRRSSYTMFLWRRAHAR